MEFANKTVLPFQPGLSNAVAVDAVAEAYITPADFRETLGDLARLSYLKARAAYRVELSGASAGGTAEVILRHGSTDIVLATLDLSTGTTFTGASAVDLSALAGATEMALVLNVTAAADAGVTAQVAGKLELEHPVVIAGRC